MAECQTWTMDEPLSEDLELRYRAGCSTHDVTFTGSGRRQVNAALQAHVEENA